MESEEVEHIEISLGGIDSDEINAEVEAEFDSMLNEVATWEEFEEFEGYELEEGDMEFLYEEDGGGLLYEEDPSWLYESLEFEEVKLEELEIEELKLDEGMDELDWNMDGYEVAETEELEMDEGGMILGDFIPLAITEKEVKALEEEGQDIILEKEIEDAIFKGIYVTLGLTWIEMASWKDTLYGEGEMTPLEEAVEFGLVTQGQADWINEPLFTVEELLQVIESGPIIQMFETSTLVTLGAEDLIISNFLMTQGKPDLMDHVIMLEDGEHAELGAALGTSKWMITDPEKTITGVGGIGGIMKKKLDADKEENEGERYEGERIGEEEERGCIGGLIDDKTCAACMKMIGTCGPMSELAKPPFHEHCRCEIYRQ